MWSSAGGCLLCSRMNLAAISVGAGMQFPSTAGVWWHSSKPPFHRSCFPSSEEGHPSTLIGVLWEQRQGRQWINKIPQSPGTLGKVPGCQWDKMRDNSICGCFASFSCQDLFSGQHQCFPVGLSSLLSHPTPWPFCSRGAPSSGPSHLGSFDQDRVTSRPLVVGWVLLSTWFLLALSLPKPFLLNRHRHSF